MPRIHAWLQSKILVWRHGIGDRTGQWSGHQHHVMGQVSWLGPPSRAWQAGVLMVSLVAFVSCSAPPDCQHLVGHHRERGQQRDPHVPGVRETGAHRHVAAPLRER